MQVQIFALLEKTKSDYEWPRLIAYHATKKGAKKAMEQALLAGNESMALLQGDSNNN
jgi:hypothetical protein